MAAKATWTGAIDFGGFPIHLRAYNLVRSRSADSFKTLCPCHQQPVVMPKTCRETGDVVILEDCFKGVEVSRSDIRMLPNEAVEAIKDSETTKQLSIHSLPPAATVPLHLALGHYRLTPDEKVAGSDGPVGILWNGLRASERCLMTEWVTRAGSRNSLVAIHADVHGLNGTTLPYATDFNDVPEHKFEVNTDAEAMFEAFSKQQGLDLSGFAHTQFVDAYAERRKQAIDAALAGKPIEVKSATPAAPAVPDLMALMKASLDQAGGAKPKKAPRKTPAKPKARVKA